MSFSEPMPLQLIALFARTAQKCRRTVTESVAHLDLTESRWRVMIHMSLLGEGCTQQMVAESLEIEMPSLTRTIKQLETTGLIKRVTDTNDKRSRLLYCYALWLNVFKKLKLMRQNYWSHLSESTNPRSGIC